MPTATQGERAPPVSAGVQHAIAYQVIDLGTQASQQGNFPPRRKVMITWELPNEKITVKDKEGHSIELPRAISKDYTLSTDKKANLRKDLEAWRGRPFTAEEVKRFEVGTVIGVNGLLNVVHKPSADGSRIYANVAGVMPLVKGMPKLTPENPTLVYDIPKEGVITFPANMPEWIQNKIKASEEYVERTNPHKSDVSEDVKANIDPKVSNEDVPF